MKYGSFHEIWHGLCWIFWIAAIGISAVTAFFWPFMDASINVFSLIISISSTLLAVWITCKAKSK